MGVLKGFFIVNLVVKGYEVRIVVRDIGDYGGFEVGG